ncbi:hypothetical protein D3C72_1893970 [compost metagenome]
MFSKPKLCNDLPCGEISAETLVPRGTEAATHGTASLRGYTQGSAIIFGNKNRLDRIAIPHVKQPLDRAV